MNNLNEYRKRFYTLMESTMGNVKPLIMEQEITTKEKNKKTEEKLTKEGWRLSSLTPDNIKTNPKLTYFKKAGLNSRGYAGVFVGESENNFKYFIFVPNYHNYRSIFEYANKKAFFDQFENNIVGIYEGGKYFEFNEEVGYDTSEEPEKTITFNESNLVSKTIPSTVILSNAPEVNVNSGKGTFKYDWSDDLYSFDFSKTVPNITGKYYLVTETSETLNNLLPNLKAKNGTHIAGFVDESSSGTVIYVNEKGVVVSTQVTFPN